jgi:hypothetical protein
MSDFLDYECIDFALKMLRDERDELKARVKELELENAVLRRSGGRIFFSERRRLNSLKGSDGTE